MKVYLSTVVPNALRTGEPLGSADVFPVSIAGPGSNPEQAQLVLYAYLDPLQALELAAELVSWAKGRLP